MIVDPAELYQDYDPWHPHASQKYALGTILDFDDGRRFRYAEAGATALVAARMNQGEAATANWLNQALTAAGIVGDQTITISSALSTALAANDLDDGWIWVNDAAGEGNVYKIKSHTTGTTPVITLADPGGLRVALTATTSEVSMIKNLWKDVIIVPAGAGTQRPVGVSLVAWTANYFGWLQTRGPVCMVVDTDDTIVNGDLAGEPSTGAVDGAVGTAEDDNTAVHYGYVLDDVTASEYALIDLTLE